MSFLPTDFVRLRTLRRGVALKLLAIPYVLLLVAIGVWPQGQHFLPTGIAHQIGSALGASAGDVETVAKVMVVLAFMYVGYIMGWALNAILLAMFGSYGLSRAFQVIAKGRLPTSWQNEKAEEIMATAESQLSEQRANIAKTGPFRFIVLRGGILFGTLAFVLIHIVLNVFQSQPIVWTGVHWKLGFWIAFGAVNAAWSWHELRSGQPDR